jgi:hypothetical protein
MSLLFQSNLKIEIDYFEYIRRAQNILYSKDSLISSQQSLWLDTKLENVPTVDCIVFDSTFSKKLNFSLQNFAPLSLFLFENFFQPSVDAIKSSLLRRWRSTKIS